MQFSRQAAQRALSAARVRTPVAGANNHLSTTLKRRVIASAALPCSLQKRRSLPFAEKFRRLIGTVRSGRCKVHHRGSGGPVRYESLSAAKEAKSQLRHLHQFPLP